MHLPPVRPEDKRMVNGKTDINQLAPFKYPWAWEYFLNANENHWTPVDIQMMRDLEDYNSRLSDEEKHMYTTGIPALHRDPRAGPGGDLQSLPGSAGDTQQNTHKQ
jgi:hypothetical protein